MLRVFGRRLASSRVLCGDASRHAGSTVRFSGWVQHIRELGGVNFVTVRDHSGTVQLRCSAEQTRQLSCESCISVTAAIRPRPAAAANPRMLSGDVEGDALAIEVHSAAPAELPLNPSLAASGEEVRLTHRQLWLRSQAMQRNLRLRSRVAAAVRGAMGEMGFVEVETPTLFKSTPEGAREFLVPTRSPGRFFALPQSPQQFKQLLMVGGVDRYYQIARCYRDEGGRADRQPEFTQVDVEMAFAGPDDVRAVAERLLHSCWSEAASCLAPLSHDLEFRASRAPRNAMGCDVTALPPLHITPPQLPFRTMRYDEAMAAYGSDKPDLR